MLDDRVVIDKCRNQSLSYESVDLLVRLWYQELMNDSSIELYSKLLRIYNMAKAVEFEYSRIAGYMTNNLKTNFPEQYPQIEKEYPRLYKKFSLISESGSESTGRGVLGWIGTIIGWAIFFYLINEFLCK